MSNALPSAPSFRKGSAQEARDEYAAALIGLAVELEEWKSAGADGLKLVGAIQRFIHAIGAQREIANGDYLATLYSGGNTK